MSYFLENVAQIVIKKCGRIVRREAIRFIAERNRLARECIAAGQTVEGCRRRYFGGP
jgi:hypothetical protein